MKAYVPTQTDADQYFGKLAELLATRKLPTEHGSARIASADEFMLMQVIQDNKTVLHWGLTLGTIVVQFKHRDTRNYVHLILNQHGWLLDIPSNGSPFNRGFFDSFVLPEGLLNV